MSLSTFINHLSLYRVCTIMGRMGYGKTACAVAIAEIMLKEDLVDGVITNFPCVLPVSRDGKDDGTLRNKVVIYDEAWTDLDSRTSMSNAREYGAYARKLGVYWLFPTVISIDRRLRSCEVTPSHKNVFTKSTVWNCTIGNTERDKETYKFTLNPERGFGLYSTSYIPVNDGGIRKRFEYTYFQETGKHSGEKEEDYKKRSMQNVETT